MSRLSLIIPCHNEEKAIPFFLKEMDRVANTMEGVEFELIFVDDGSTDSTLELLKKVAGAEPAVRYISFSRNFGKESAMLAGLKAAHGDYAAFMDADLQDPPQLLPEMLKAVREEGYDCAGTRRITRKGEPPIRSFFARMFYKLINCMSETSIVDGARDFKLMSRQAADALLSLPECNRFSKGLNEWIGFRTKWIEFENTNRVAGETKWSFWKLFKYSIDGFVGFSTAPLSLASMLGICFTFLSTIALAWLIIRQLIWHSSVSGWTSLACIIVFFCGIQLLCLGIIGQYLAKTYTEIKRRPHYIVKDSNTQA